MGMLYSNLVLSPEDLSSEVILIHSFFVDDYSYLLKAFEYRLPGKIVHFSSATAENQRSYEQSWFRLPAVTLKQTHPNFTPYKLVSLLLEDFHGKGALSIHRRDEEYSNLVRERPEGMKTSLFDFFYAQK